MAWAAGDFMCGCGLALCVPVTVVMIQGAGAFRDLAQPFLALFAVWVAPREAIRLICNRKAGFAKSLPLC